MEDPQKEAKLREFRIKQEIALREAMSDVLVWLTEFTQTIDEQDPKNPYKPFPKHKPYFRPLIQSLENEPVFFLKKSRTMMASWLVSAWAAHKAFNNPATGVMFQSQDEDRAVADIEKVKVLWDNSHPELKKRWPLSKPLEKQAYNRLDLANDSWLIGIPGDPNKARSLHPTIAVLDEAAVILRGNESYNIVLATRALHLICLSSAEEGWYEDVCSSAIPVDWPEYKSTEKAATQ